MLLARLQQLHPPPAVAPAAITVTAPSAAAPCSHSSACAAAAAAAESDHKDDCCCESDVDDAAAAAEDAVAAVRHRSIRRSLTRHAAALPASIMDDEFGSYLKFVNRHQQCDALVAHLQTSYLRFRARAATAVPDRVSGDAYLKALQVASSAGAPGIGKTTWARMALDHVSDSFLSQCDPDFRSTLTGCKKSGWRYRVCYGENEPSPEELQAPAFSLAARWLWEHLKYQLPQSSGIQSYGAFWQFVARNRSVQQDFTCADVLDYICASSSGSQAQTLPPAQRMMLINLDEINALFPDDELHPTKTAYLRESLRALLQLQLDGRGFVFPVLTATKALKVKEVIQLSGCSFVDIPLPLLGPAHVLELMHDLHSRALQQTLSGSGSGSAGAASVSAALSAVRPGEPLGEAAVPPNSMLSHLLDLMAGHPRFLEKLLFRLGRPDGPTECWTPAAFVARMAALRTPAFSSLQLENLLLSVSDAIGVRYAAFKRYLDEPRFSVIVPQLLGYTLFEWPVTRPMVFTEGAYQCSVQALEEDGVIFLTPVQVHDDDAASRSSSSPLRCDVQLRLVLPFLWLHRMHVRHAVDHGASAVQLPLVKTLACRLSPSQNEELTMSVLALKCFCLVKMGRTRVCATELFGPDALDVADVRLPLLAETQWPVVKLQHQVTAGKWSEWVVSAAKDAAPRPHFFLNGERAPFWDGCALTSPPIFVQDKQGVVSRQRVALGKAPELTKWAKIQAEMDKCTTSHTPAPLFLLCTDALLTDRPDQLPAGVIVLDQRTQAHLFGPLLASRKAMCLSELWAAAPTPAAAAAPAAAASSSMTC